MKTNVTANKPVFTHNGAESTNVSPIQKLRRLVMSCMLWEDTFYVDGKTVTEQIKEVCKELDQLQVLNVAREVHTKGLLRHVPLWLIVCSFESKKRLFANKDLEGVKHYIADICSRPDQMTELLSLYWKDGKKPIPSQMKKGLAKAFCKFDEYSLAKYNRDAPIKLRDVLFLCHAKPKNEDQRELWKRLVSNTMKTPDTWEVRLSAREDKKESFEELLKQGKMGKLAIIRNLRNMYEEGLDKDLVITGLLSKSRPILPFQFLVAAKHCPRWEDIIDKSMIQACEGKQKIKGNTIVLVDVSGSMNYPISGKSDTSRMDAASGLSILLREVCEKVEFYSFSCQIIPIPNRQGMALRDAIIKSQPHSSTFLGAALQYVSNKRNKSIVVDRIVVITDEQANDVPPKMNIEKCYVLNVGCYENGIKNNGEWFTINGFSQNSIDYISEIESEDN